MHVLIHETGERRSLEMIDWMDEKDYSEILMLTSGSIGSFVYDPEQNLYCCSQKTWEWWDGFLSRYHRFPAALAALRE